MNPSRDRHPVEALADEFTERWRRGERPEPREYAERYPEWQAEILDLFPLLVEMEAARTEGPAAPRSFAAPDCGQLGDFRLLREIGRGGMGIVYEAEQLSLGRHVALKVLPQELLANSRHRLRFEREAKAAAKLHHTNIVPVFGVGEDNGVGYYVMQFIQGLALDVVIAELRRLRADSRDERPTEEGVGELRVSRRDVDSQRLAQTLAAGGLHSAAASAPGAPPLVASASAASLKPALNADRAASLSAVPHAPMSESYSVGNSDDIAALNSSSSGERSGSSSSYWQSVANIGRQVADALSYAHEQGVLHRDIKPANLLLDVRGAVWVADFGLAKLNDDADLTQTGDLLGTVRYMAPETFQGGADARSEIYSLGLTLYELLAFRPAFDETDRSKLLHQALHSRPPSLASLNPRIPADLRTIVHKAIEREPADRYATARDLADDLTRFLRDEPIRARPLSLVERARRWSRRNRSLSAALASVALLVTILALGSTLAASYFRATNRQLRSTVRELESAEQQLREHVAALNDSARDLTASRNDARRQAEENQALAQVAQTTQQREAELRALAEEQARSLRRTLYAAEMNLAGEAAASASGLWRVRQLTSQWIPAPGEVDQRGWEWSYLDAICRQYRASLPCPGAQAAAWSPDGKWLATGCRNGQIKLWDPTTATCARVISERGGMVRHLAWSPDSRRLAAACFERTIQVWDVDSANLELTLRGHSAPVNSVAFSPDGRELASHASENHGELWLWDLTTGQPRAKYDVAGEEAHVVWRPHSRHVATALQVLDADSGETVGRHSGWRMAWSSDGKRLAAIRDRRLEVVEFGADAAPVSFAYEGAFLRSVAWHPNGVHLATGTDDNTILVWDTATAQIVATLRGHSEWVLEVPWSPDGRQLASAASDGVHLWDWPPRPNPLRCRTELTNTRGLAWDQRGERVVVNGGSGVASWKLTNQTPEMRLSAAQAGTVSSFSPSMSWRDQFHLLAARRADATMLFDTRDWSTLRTLPDLDKDVRSIALSPDGQRLATSSWEDREREQAIVRIYSTSDGSMLNVTSLASDLTGSLRWSPNGSRLACGGWSDAALLDGSTGQLLTRLKCDPGQRWVYGIAWRPDGRQIALACMDRMVHLYDADTGELRARLVGHTDEVQAVTWSPDGTRLATGGKDRTVRIWSADHARQLLSLAGHAATVSSVEWSADGSQLASVDQAGDILVWRTTDPASRRDSAAPVEP